MRRWCGNSCHRHFLGPTWMESVTLYEDAGASCPSSCPFVCAAHPFQKLSSVFVTTVFLFLPLALGRVRCPVGSWYPPALLLISLYDDDDPLMMSTLSYYRCPLPTLPSPATGAQHVTYPLVLHSPSFEFPLNHTPSHPLPATHSFTSTLPHPFLYLYLVSR